MPRARTRSNPKGTEVKYRVVKVPLPDTSNKIEQLINQSTPPGHTLVTMVVDRGELILVFCKG